MRGGNVCISIGAIKILTNDNYVLTLKGCDMSDSMGPSGLHAGYEDIYT